MEQKIPSFNAKFTTSAANFSQLPPPKGFEFCLLGRSNVGKSSFLNHTFGNYKLARVSKTPGKTRLANIFTLNDDITWVDLPGYGHARASHKEKDRWSKLILDYCEKRENFRGVIWLLDIRHPGMKIDLEAGEWLNRIGVPVLPVLTKADKLNQKKRNTNVKEYSKIFNFTVEPIVYSVNKSNYRDIWWKKYFMWVEQLNLH